MGAVSENARSFRPNLSEARGEHLPGLVLCFVVTPFHFSAIHHYFHQFCNIFWLFYAISISS